MAAGAITRQEHKLCVQQQPSSLGVKMLMACQLVDCLIERMLRCQKEGKALCSADGQVGVDYLEDIVLDYWAG